MIKRGDETILTRKEALNDARFLRIKAELDYNLPFEVKKYKDEIKTVDDLFCFYKLCRGYKVNMGWLDFKQRWFKLDDSERNQIYNYIGIFRERENRDMKMLRAKLYEGLVECMADDETVVSKVIKFTNNDVPNFLKRLRRAERYSLEHPSKLRYMTGAA